MRKNRNVAAIPFLFTSVSILLTMSAFIYLIYRAVTPDITNYDMANANYYNSQDGKYYQDAELKILANDNTEYLINLLNSAEEVFIPAGNYLCTGQISIKGKNVSITGVKGKTRIIFSGSSNTPRVKSGVGAFIVNDSHSRSYSADTAQNINISGISFEYKQKVENSINTLLEFANVKGGTIKDCSFISDEPSEKYVTLMDLNSCCKNITVESCQFQNMTGASKGSCIWIRNRSDTTGQEQNTTENITVTKCTFTQNSADEIVAAYSSIGNVKNIYVTKSTFLDYSDINVKVFATYPSENVNSGTVENIQFNKNKIYSEVIVNYIITVGGSNRTNSISGVEISENEIEVKNSTDGKCFIIYVNDINTNVKNVNAAGNTIKVNNLPNSTGIYNADFTNSNKINGVLRRGIVYGEVTKNTIDGAYKGIVSPTIARQNKTTNCEFGISCGIESTLIEKNEITVKQGSGVCGIEVQNVDSSQGKMEITISKNEITTTEKAQYAFIIHSGTIRLVNNSISGPSSRIYINEKAQVIN